MVAEGHVFQDRYRLDACIAIGGMGEVWQATDLLLDRRVAVKMLRPEHAHNDEGLARFRAEAHYAGSLSHPNIAHVYDYCEPEPPDPGYLVTELVDGPSLARLLDQGPLSPARTMDIVAQSARGLAAAHRTGLIHRDIKPGNLLVSSDGVVKITDFGVAHAAGSTALTQEGVLIGTPAYFAPERAGGAPATPAADLYALGVVAHHCLTGQLPFQGEPLAVVIQHMERGVPPLPSSVPPEVAALVTELTSRDPEDRPSGADEVAVRAAALAGMVSGTATPLPFPAAAATPAAVAAVEKLPTLDLPWGRARRRRVLAGLGSFPVRAGLAAGGLAAAGLVSWMLVTLPGSPSAPPHTLTTPPSSRAHGGHSGGAAQPSTAATTSQTGQGGSDAVHPNGSPSPEPSATPTPTPTPSNPAPTPTPTPTPSNPAPTPTPTPSAAPTANPTAAASTANLAYGR